MITVYMKTNSAGTGGVGQGTSETSWKITDAAGTVVASRSNASLSTVYEDTVTLPNAGMYKLSVTDGGCDGLYWWVYGQNPQFGITSGNLIVRNASTGSNIPVKGSAYSGTYHDDFGCGFSQSFSVAGIQPPTTGVQNNTANRSASLIVFPNPATKSIQTKLFGLINTVGQLQILDVVGKAVMTQQTSAAANSINIAQLAPGLYNVVYIGSAGEKLSTRLTITE